MFVNYSARIPPSRGSRDDALHIGDNTSLPPMRPRCNVRTHPFWVEFVVALSGYSGFSLLQNSTEILGQLVCLVAGLLMVLLANC